MKRQLIIFVIAVFAATTGLVSALPTQPAKTGKESKTQADTITLTFPRDRSLGGLYKVTVINNQVAEVAATPWQARGTVFIPKETKLRLQPSYYGARDASLLLQLPGKSIVSIDARRMDNITDDCVSQLVKIPGLLQLLLEDTDITDNSLAAISQMKSLTDLQIEQVNISSKGLAQLGGLTTLRILRLAVSDVGDSALPNLVALRDLTVLQLTRSGISDKGLRSIGKMSQLQFLDLAQNRDVTDAGIAELTGLKNLLLLELSNTAVTIGCLPYLKKMKSLVDLHLTECRITESELLKIRRELPHCAVTMVNKPRIDPSVFAPLH